MSRSSKKKAEYEATVEATLGRMYQEYLDLMSEKMGRKLTKEDLDTQEKRDRLAQEWKSQDLGEQTDATPPASRDGKGKRSSSKPK